MKPSRPSGSRSCVPPSVQRRGTLASPRDPARSVTPRLDGGRMLVYMPAFPAAKAARPTPPSLGKVSLGADPQTLEMGCAGKSRILGLILVSRGSIFSHIFQDHQWANAAMKNAAFAYLTCFYQRGSCLTEARATIL